MRDLLASDRTGYLSAQAVEGAYPGRAALARAEGVSRAAVTQGRRGL